LAECIQQDVVLSTGGGVVLSSQNRDLLAQNPQNIYLKADFETLFRRIEEDQENQRPLYLTKSKADLQEIFGQRQALYEAVATQTIDVVGKTPQEIIEEIQ
jgi:shikimate kinase